MPYRNYFDIDTDYFPAVNEAVINSKPDMWKKFFPHETFITLLKNVVNVLDRKQKLSIWVEGAYGTGKSHAVLTLKKLLDVDSDEMKKYFERYDLDTDLRNKLQRIKDSGKILTVHRYGSSNIYGDNDLVLAVQESVEKALSASGTENKASDSLRESVIRYLSDPENKQSFNIYVKGSYADLFGGDDADAIIEKLKTYHDAALHTIMDKIFKVARERQIRAFTMTAEDLCEWLKEVMHSNGLKAIIFIWDEFTEYFYNNTRNLTGFQELCELSETEPFYFVLVTHVSSGLFHEGDKDFIKLNGRFLNPHSLISLPENIAFQLMGAAMEKSKDETVLAEWKDITLDLADRTKESRKLVKSIAGINDDEMLGILPIHPYTALLLKHISSAFDSNQRSMFDFIKNDRGDDIKGFQWFIDNHGPEDDNPLLSVDMLWEFFYDKGRDLLAPDIRSVLDYFTRGANQKLDNDEKRILKTVLLLQAISHRAGDSVELFIPNDKNIELAFEGTDINVYAGSCAERLVRNKILFRRQLGGGSFQYAAYVNEVSGEELEKYKAEVDRKTTTSLINEQLTDKTRVIDAITLEGALKLRYELRYVSVNDFDQAVRALRNRDDEAGNRIHALVCFAKNDAEGALLSKKIREALSVSKVHAVFIDTTATPFGADGYEQYRSEMAQAMYQQGKDNNLSSQYADNARDALKKWKNRIVSGEFIIFTEKYPDGERAVTMDAMIAFLRKINKEEFPDCLEGAYNVLPTMFMLSAIKLGVECGAKRITKQIFSSSKAEAKLENALREAWNDSEYWKTHPNILISRIKIAVDSEIRTAFNESGRVSIKSIYDILKAKPYGFMPCNFTAFILGFVLKEYIDGTYSWSDGLTNDVLDLNKLKEMVGEIISLQITPNPRYRDKYIVEMTEAEKSFNEITSYAFNIPISICTSLEQTREHIRNKMKEFSFPIWTIKCLLPSTKTKTDSSVLAELIDDYCGIANSNNINGSRTESDIAQAVGNLSLKNPDAKEDLKTLLTKENCISGMKIYVREFDGGELVSLADEIEDNGQYINALRSKFDADAANWVWNIETARQKIREVILEYRIISESNKILPKNISFSDTIREWCEKCNMIRISYAAAKNYLGDLAPFPELLHSVKKSGGNVPDSQKQKFLDLLIAHADDFSLFFGSQLELFRKVCAYYLDDFSDDEVKAFFLTIPSGVFTYDKTEYMNLIDSKAKDYRSSLSSRRLKNLWKEKTGSISPQQWSKEHMMPLLCLVPESEIQTARSAFDAVNNNHPDASSAEKAISYLENASFYSLMNDNEELSRIFSDRIIKQYSVMLNDVEEVKEYLNSRISSEPYNWFGLPEVDTRLRQMAEDKYFREGCAKALEKIDRMNLDDVKRYLKELIKDNMTVGLEIIKSN